LPQAELPIGGQDDAILLNFFENRDYSVKIWCGSADKVTVWTQKSAL